MLRAMLHDLCAGRYGLRWFYWGQWYRKRHAIAWYISIALPPYGFWAGVVGITFFATLDELTRRRDQRLLYSARVVRELGS